LGEFKQPLSEFKQHLGDFKQPLSDFKHPLVNAKEPLGKVIPWHTSKPPEQRISESACKGW
jgi:hypothetical protein